MQRRVKGQKLKWLWWKKTWLHWQNSKQNEEQHCRKVKVRQTVVAIKVFFFWTIPARTYDVAEARVCHVKYHSEGHPRFLLSIALQPECDILLLVQHCFGIFNVKFDLKPDCWLQTGKSNERLSCHLFCLSIWTRLVETLREHLVTYTTCCPPCRSHGGRRHQSQTSIWVWRSRWDLKFSGRRRLHVSQYSTHKHFHCSLANTWLRG